MPAPTTSTTVKSTVAKKKKEITQRVQTFGKKVTTIQIF
jgi:hypothetical protein